jgi:hypothetical protein
MGRLPAVLLLVLLLAGLVTTTGCQHHVKLRASGPSAPLKQRLAEYRQLKPLTQVRSPYLYLFSAVERHFLLLADGRRVYHAEDLLPVVRPDSPTARYIARVQRLRKIQFWVGLASMAATITGTVLAIVGFTGDDTPMGVTGCVVGGVGMMGGFNLAKLFDAQARDTALSAFTSYDRALRQYMGLCPVGEGDAAKVGDCP